jgi:hypothetical protein
LPALPDTAKSDSCKAVEDGEHQWEYKGAGWSVCFHCSERRYDEKEKPPTLEEAEEAAKAGSTRHAIYLEMLKAMEEESKKAKEQEERMAITTKADTELKGVLEYIKGQDIPIEAINTHYDSINNLILVTVRFDMGEAAPLRLRFKLYRSLFDRYDFKADEEWRYKKELADKIIKAYNTELEKLADQFMTQGE